MARSGTHCISRTPSGLTISFGHHSLLATTRHVVPSRVRTQRTPAGAVMSFVDCWCTNKEIAFPDKLFEIILEFFRKKRGEMNAISIAYRLRRRLSINGVHNQPAELKARNPQAGGPPAKPMMMMIAAFPDGTDIPTKIHAGRRSDFARDHLDECTERHGDASSSHARPGSEPEQNHRRPASLDRLGIFPRMPPAFPKACRKALNWKTAPTNSAPRGRSIVVRALPLPGLATTTHLNCSPWIRRWTCSPDQTRSIRARTF